MKALFRILIVGTCLVNLWYYTDIEEESSGLSKNVISLKQSSSSLEIAASEGLTFMRPTTGISIFVGESEKEILYNFGRPSYVESTIFGYEWWIYEQQDHDLMVGMKDGVVNQIYTNANAYNVSPYEINQTLDDIYRQTVFENEIMVETEEQIYLFMMDEADMRSRILVKCDDLYIQLYIDSLTNTLAGIRFLDGETLVLHQPYALQSNEQTMGRRELLQRAELVPVRQMLFLTNSFRAKNGFEPLADGSLLTEEPNTYELMLPERVDVISSSASEQKTFDYIDAVEAIHDWMNSEEDRVQLFNEEITEADALVRYYAHHK